ncbi:hypothetical protein GGS23DRAFT_617352 [Durotheca rogersii]|uniref:uncharacterized protein n=1 Tax=Durotheca rogersii TaxID=419775 RepID=UPI00221E3D76|nr:uncharacterized protein GGS23DRAFT_617352 [Durotheca rogersii]KAI5866265.1 hypothetical protein GGS23DRAFT_617352 [Durotheca rogersii]
MDPQFDNQDSEATGAQAAEEVEHGTFNMGGLAPELRDMIWSHYFNHPGCIILVHMDSPHQSQANSNDITFGRFAYREPNPITLSISAIETDTNKPYGPRYSCTNKQAHRTAGRIGWRPLAHTDVTRGLNPHLNTVPTQHVPGPVLVPSNWNDHVLYPMVALGRILNTLCDVPWIGNVKTLAVNSGYYDFPNVLDQNSMVRLLQSMPGLERILIVLKPPVPLRSTEPTDEFGFVQGNDYLPEVKQHLHMIDTDTVAMSRYLSGSIRGAVNDSDHPRDIQVLRVCDFGCRFDDSQDA